MKKIITIWSSFLLLILAGCFEDEGNYDYKPVLSPVFTFESPQYLVCYGGDTARLDAAFYFEADSLARLANVRYEWKLNGVVLSEEKDFRVPTDSIIKKIGLTTYPDDEGLWGTFNVIEKSTGIRYIHEILFLIRPQYSKGQWLLLSEHGNHARLTYLSVKKVSRPGKVDTIYTAIPGIYEQKNGSVIPGKPIRLIDHVAKNISVAVGATLVITDQVAYDINNESMMKARDLAEEFLGETPASPITDAYHAKDITYVATADGKLYKRTFTTNWLGGKFISVPYTIDDKGYSITRFGKGASENNSTMFPCYDELNRRVVIINQRPILFSKLDAVTPVGSSHPLAVWEMEEGTDVLYLAEVKDLYVRLSCVFCMLFNQGGQTYMADFVLQSRNNEYYANCIEDDNARVIPFPGGTLDKDSKVLISSNTRRNIIFYTRGNELRYVNRTNDSDHPCITFDSPVTTLGMTSYNYDYDELAIGLQNGDFMFVNVANIDQPYIVGKSRINLGGKVVGASQLGCGYHVE